MKQSLVNRFVDGVQEMKKKIFRRTDLGNEELRSRSLNLSKEEQFLLLSIDGRVDEDMLTQQFAQDGVGGLALALEDLQQKKLIEILSEVGGVAKGNVNIVSSLSDGAEDFFSSSLNPFQGGSGLVVDTKTNSMRSMRHRKNKIQSEIDVDFYVPLEGADSEVEDKRRVRLQKLVEVYPNPAQKKKKRKKPATPPPENKWFLRVYVGLILGGIIAVVFAIAYSR